jgi:hypothetical protein
MELLYIYVVTSELINTWVLVWILDSLDTCRLQHLDYNSIVVLSPIHSCSLYSAIVIKHTVYSLPVVNYTRTESSWSAVSPLVLRYRLPTEDIPLPGFPNCLRGTAAANLDS